MTRTAESIPTANPDQVAYWNADSGERWKTFQAQIDRHLAALTERLLDRARPLAGEQVIDVGCGAGDASLRLAARVGQGRVLGVDISEVLLQVARARAAAGGHGNVAFLRADAQVHAFEADTFDLVASRFGVMFFADSVAAFRNLARALKPGGRFLFACWGPLAENPWFRVPQQAAVRHLGPPAPTPPHAPGPMAFADAAHVAALLAAAGLDAIEVAAEQVTLDGGDSVQEIASFACRMGLAARRIAEVGATPETVQRIAADIAEGFRAYAGAEGVRVPAAINFISARRAATV